jgi:outer membrane lipoprotein-sorting protein
MRRGRVLTALLLGTVTACAGRTVSLPTGEGASFPDYEAAWHNATRGCREVRSLSAELSISGRAGRQRLRGHVLAGLAAPDRIRLEAAAPFGPPLFILVADGAKTTLLLPRDNRVLGGEPPAAILDALVGLDLGPSDLLALLSGCVAPDTRARGGRLFPSEWARIDLDGGDSAYLQHDLRTGWLVRAGVRQALSFDYDPGRDGMPGSVHVRADSSRVPGADLRIGLSQIAINPPLGPEVFSVRVPPDATPISLAELRRAGPLGETR